MRVPPLVITGMHRSGTSATARLFHHAGLDVGRRLLAPALDNPVGYYEDLDFCELNMDLLAAGITDDPGRRPDWAFPDRIVPGRWTPLRPRAEALVAARSARGVAWGFKDPRTSVLLDFWHDVVPDAGYVFVYRAPWEVLTSLMGTQLRLFHGRADLAVRVWTDYNQRLLDFRSRHPESTSLVHLDAVARRPAEVIRLVQNKFGRGLDVLDAGAVATAFVNRLLRRSDATSALAELVAADHPAAMDVYGRLEEAADLRAGAQTTARGGVDVDIETLGGRLEVAAVLVGAPADGLEDTTRVARPDCGTAPGQAADAAITALPDDLVAVLFDGQLRPAGLTMAVAAMQQDAGLGAVLLAPGGLPQPVTEYDPLTGAESGAGVLVRRATWLATRGFAAVPAPTGYDGWTYLVACAAAGERVARIDGAIHLPGNRRDDPAARKAVLAAHPELAARRVLALERQVAEAERRAEVAEWNEAGAHDREAGAGQRAEEANRRAQESEHERDRLAEQLAAITGLRPSPPVRR